MSAHSLTGFFVGGHMDRNEIRKWQQRITRAENLQSQKREERIQIIKLYTGTFFGSPIDNQSEMNEVNFTYEYLKIMVSAIYNRNPFIFSRARSSKWAAFAETMQTVINYYWREKYLKQKIKKTIVDAALTPPGFIEVGYRLSTTKKSPSIDEILGLKPIKTKTEAEQGELDETIKDDDVYASYISSWNVIWPDGYHDIRDCPYIMKKQTITFEDLMANPTYKPIKAKLRSGAPYQTAQKPTKYRMQDYPINIGTSGVTPGIDNELIPVNLVHIWDKRSRRMFTLAKNFYEDTLFEKDWNYLIDGFSLYPLIFNDIPQTDEKANSYPLSDIVPMIPQLKELSYISSAMNKHRKRAGTLIVAKKGTLTPTEISNLQNASDLDVVEFPELTEQALRGFTPPALPNDFYKIRFILLEDLMRISGFNQLISAARGIETATESENVRAGALLRQSEKIDIIEDFTVDVARGMAGLIWQFIQDKRRIQNIIGEPVTEEMWPTLPDNEDEAREIIQKELQFNIEAGSTRPPKDEMVERRQWQNEIGILRANFPYRIREDKLLKQWLKKIEFRDIDDLVITNDDEEIAVAQQENRLLMQGIRQLNSPNENHMLHLKVHSQIQQTSGLNPTPEYDEHVIKHAEYLKEQTPTIQPQKGDKSIAPITTTPEIRRQGTPTYSDLVGGTRASTGVGGEKGGK